jgi:hypothetical protein
MYDRCCVTESSTTYGYVIILLHTLDSAKMRNLDIQLAASCLFSRYQKYVNLHLLYRQQVWSCIHVIKFDLMSSSLEK